MQENHENDKVVIVIPSRLGSSRFPNKPLAKINGKEMILHVCDRASDKYPVVVATPDKEIYDLVTKNGYQAVITSKECLTGTDRVAEVAEKIDADIYVNVQGDEPLINTTDINNIVVIKKIMYNSVISGMALIQNQSDNTNIVKVQQANNELIWLSRTTPSKYKHVGIYAFNREELKKFKEVPESKKIELLKEHENIEILRFLEIGIKVFMIRVKSTTAVDVPEDIDKILEVIRNGT